MGKLKSYTLGDKHGRLTLLDEVEPDESKRDMVRRGRFACDCGSDYIGRLDTWDRGTTQSCGCLQRERTSAARKTHGRSRNPDPLYRAWTSMRYRTSPAGWKAKPTYTGVSRDSRWDSFEGFLANPPTGAPYAVGLVLSRIGDVGDYSPENCRWITKAENMAERLDPMLIRLPDGRAAVDVARENGVSSQWRRRIADLGWDVERAVTQAVWPITKRS